MDRTPEAVVALFVLAWLLFAAASYAGGWHW